MTRDFDTKNRAVSPVSHQSPPDEIDRRPPDTLTNPEAGLTIVQRAVSTDVPLKSSNASKVATPSLPSESDALPQNCRTVTEPDAGIAGTRTHVRPPDSRQNGSG
ncbi:MAG: hypothetical protein EBQ56_04450 [Proteobacteria bacterium]|nr:hypothetical protein [Pseudomonadota bacterium]